jgi:hydrogenase/urease accessory protein HupE
MKIKFLFSIFFFVSFNLFAHQTGLSYIEIDTQNNFTYNITYKKPLEDASAKPIAIHYPANCKKTLTRPKNYENGFVIEYAQLQCQPPGLLEKRIWIEGLVRSDKGVMVRFSDAQFTQKALLRSTTPFIKIDKQNSLLSYIKEYIALGIEHILSGYDHLSFVLALLLLARSKKALLLAVTAFTLSHSITLALAIFDLVSIPVAFVESQIALSIVFLARELLIKNANTLTHKHLEYIAFIFGLLHGLGFSTALKEIGLPHNDLVAALFSFNIGIELGQLLFIAIASIVLYLLYHIFPKEKCNTVLAYLIGGVASYWLIERVANF